MAVIHAGSWAHRLRERVLTMARWRPFKRFTDKAAATSSTSGQLPADNPYPKPASKLDLAERSYNEVLDATKHQDDKVGRFLTAIAFLTTGSIALITATPGDALARDFEIRGDASYPLLAWATGAFLAFTLASVTLLLLCLSVPVRLPKSEHDRFTESHLFYSYIASRRPEEWARKWDVGDPLDQTKVGAIEASITNDYIGEAQNLAERTNAKYRHSYEASWLFVCALLFLGIAMYLRVLAYLTASNDASGDSQDIPFFEPLELGLLVGVVSVHAALQVYARAVHDIRSAGKAYESSYDRAYNREVRKLKRKDRVGLEKRSTGRDAALHRQRRRTPLSIVGPVGFSVAMVAAWPHNWIAPVVAGASVSLGLWVTFDTWRETKDAAKDDPGRQVRFWSWRAWWFPVISGAVTACIAYWASDAGGAWQLVAVPLPVLVLGLFNTSRPMRSHRKARSLVKNSARSAARKDISNPPEDQVAGAGAST